MGLSLIEFQAPLFSCLAISPIILFRTCQLQSSRFGRHFYLSVCCFCDIPPSLLTSITQFLMSLGDIKPTSLRETESLIWKDLYLVARCQLSAEDMFNHVIDHIVEPKELESFRLDKHRLRRYFAAKYDPIKDHIGFFLPGKCIDSQVALSTNSSMQLWPLLSSVKLMVRTLPLTVLIVLALPRSKSYLSAQVLRIRKHPDRRLPLSLAKYKQILLVALGHPLPRTEGP